MAADDFKAPALSYIDIERRATRFIGDILMPERVRRYLEGKLNIADILEIDFVIMYKGTEGIKNGDDTAKDGFCGLKPQVPALVGGACPAQ